MSLTTGSSWRGLVLGLLLLGFIAPARAGEPVKVSVLSILATDRNSTVDKKLEGIAREVQKLDPKLTGFKLAKMTCKSLPVGGREPFELAANQIATVTVERGADDDNRVQLKVSPPLLGEITYTTTCGKFLPILTRYRTKDRELLILAVRVQPCTGDEKGK